MTAITMDPTESTEPSTYLKWDQILLFGDSITQGAANQEKGFAFAPALQNGA